MGINYGTIYDHIMNLQAELLESNREDYRVVKALAATYELQDYLANRIAEAEAEE